MESLIHTAYVDCFLFQMSVGSDSDLNENEKNPYQQSVQENEIDICEEILTHLADTSVQPDLNPNSINQGPADVLHLVNSIGTPSNNMPLRESTNVLKNGLKKKRARTQVEKSERNAKEYPVLQPCKESCSKRCITNFSSDDRALINSRFWKLSFTEHRQWLAAYINQVDAKNKTSQQKDGGRLSSLVKDGKNVIACRSMFLSTLGLKTDGMITEMVHAQRCNSTC